MAVLAEKVRRSLPISSIPLAVVAMFIRCHLLFVALLLLVVLPTPAIAGMPSVRFSDIAALRLQGISFFLVALLMSAFAIQLLWNRLAKDFTQLPRLNYGRACGIVVLWGLLFVIVLTMISGARELMTPGAWTRNGTTYQLADGRGEPRDETPITGVAADNAPNSLAERRLKLAELRFQLRRYASEHDGNFPTSPEESGIAESFWQLPDISGLQYVYVAGRTVDDLDLPLAFEPELYDGDPLVLMVGGEITTLPRDRLEQSLATTAETP